MKISGKNQRKRWLIFIWGLIVSGFGVAFSTQAGMGTSPISSVPYVLTFLCPLSFGTVTFVVNLLFLLGQVLILRREFDLFQLLQIPMLFIFGVCIDLGMFCSGPFLLHNFLAELPGMEGSFWVYASRHAELILGCGILALGIVFQLLADCLLLPGDAFVKVVCQKFRLEFSRIKIFFDGSLVLLSLTLCWTFLGGLQGIREGTFLAILYVGSTIRLLLPRIRRFSCFCLTEEDEIIPESAGKLEKTV